MTNDTQGGRAVFASKIGLVMATAGSAVGLGNIWRFPVMTGEGGGAAFLLVYLVSVLLVGLPLMLAEFAVGRHAHANGVEAYRKLTSHKLFRHVGRMGVYIAWFILCYYIVVSAWALNYLVDSLRGVFVNVNAEGSTLDYAVYFQSFISNPWMPIVYVLIFLLISHYVIVRGVQRGIERFSKVMMPMLFVMLVLLAVCSCFTAGAKEGLRFLFFPDFSKLNFHTMLSAVGQSFYSLSIGMGALCTFASYFKPETNLRKTALSVVIIDTFVAIVSGIVIFPAVFAAGQPVDSGASLVFVALPQVFQTVFGGLPWLAYAVSVMFYFLLFIATLTSIISLHESVTAYLSEDFKLVRSKAAGIVTLVTGILGSVCALSMGPLKDLPLGTRNLFDWFDYLSCQVFLPVSGILISVFVGWFMDRKIVRSELASAGSHNAMDTHLVVCLLKYVIPVVIFVLFVTGL